MTDRREAAAAPAVTPLLATALQMAVPLEIEKLRPLPDRILEGLRADLDGLTGVASDAMQYGGKGAGQAFAAHVRAFALMALLAEGGVDFCGLHWCDISGCRAAGRFDEAHEGRGRSLRPDGGLVPSPRRVVDVPDAADLL